MLLCRTDNLRRAYSLPISGIARGTVGVFRTCSIVMGFYSLQRIGNIYG